MTAGYFNLCYVAFIHLQTYLVRAAIDIILELETMPTASENIFVYILDI